MTRLPAYIEGAGYAFARCILIVRACGSIAMWGPRFRSCAIAYMGSAATLLINFVIRADMLCSIAQIAPWQGQAASSATLDRPELVLEGVSYR